jgi:hypothetical protein
VDAQKVTGASLERDRLTWRGVQMDDDILKAVAELRKKGFEKLDLSVLDAYRETA